MQNTTQYYRVFATENSAPIRTFRWRVAKLTDEQVSEIKGFRTQTGNGTMVFVPVGRIALLDNLLNN